MTTGLKSRQEKTREVDAFTDHISAVDYMINFTREDAKENRIIQSTVLQYTQFYHPI